jgi:hypothetical protein
LVAGDGDTITDLVPVSSSLGFSLDTAFSSRKLLTQSASLCSRLWWNLSPF